MRKPCGNEECERWLAKEGYYETSDAVCYECGFRGPFYRWQQQNQDDDDCDNDGEW